MIITRDSIDLSQLYTHSIKSRPHNGFELLIGIIY